MTRDEAYEAYCRSQKMGDIPPIREGFDAGWAAALDAVELELASPYGEIYRGVLEKTLFLLKG